MTKNGHFSLNTFSFSVYLIQFFFISDILVSILPVVPYSLITLINEAVDDGKQKLQVRQLKDQNVTPLDADSPTRKHQQSIVYSLQGSNLSNYGYIEVAATEYLR